MDIHISGLTGTFPDDYEKEICTVLLVLERKKQGVKKKYLTPCFLYSMIAKVARSESMEEKVEQAYLYDFYGELLNEHQRRIYEDFVFNDLSLGEIASCEGISRQGVHDLIKRCNKMLEGYEEKLHLVKKFLETKQKVEKINKLAESFRAGRKDTVIDEIERISGEILEEL